MSVEAPLDPTTPLAVVAQITRVVSRVVDRVMGDRSDYPLMVAAACVEALKLFEIESRVMYGQLAWVEILDDQTAIWAGCWGENIGFWVATQFGEVVDLNSSVVHRKRIHDMPDVRSIYSPPILWSAEIPSFYRYQAEGVAELELLDPEDIRKYQLVVDEIRAHCGPAILDADQAAGAEMEFPNEPILCPGRKVLDDSKQTFRHFDRALAVNGVPEAPVFSVRDPDSLH
ncbi:hypothetical protein K2X30_02205 [bacterium]|jgi:hypothetical protein|nr:hypothetical protein [bacterium]